MDYRVINSPDGIIRAGKVHIAGNEAFPFTKKEDSKVQTTRT